MKFSGKKKKKKKKKRRTCVNPLVSFQMWTLGVDFGAAGEITVVDPTLLQFGIVASVILDCFDTEIACFSFDGFKQKE